jgi:hypothetical protein
MAKIKVQVTCEMEIDEDSLRITPETREEDIQSEISWAIQRVQNGFDERVSWSIDYYLNENMPKWLSALKPVKGKPQGVPMVMYDEEYLSKVDGDLDPIEELKAKNKWNKTLDTMIEGFEAAKEIEEHWIQESPDNELWQKFNLGMDNFKKYYFCLWD